VVELHGPDGQPIATAQGRSNRSPRITAQPLTQNGTYVVLVRHLSDWSPWQYTLTVIKNPGPTATDPDGGDIAPGESKTGSIESGDLDAFAFSANAGDAATVLVGKTGGHYYFEPVLELHGPDGRKIAGPSANITAQPLTQSGTYLVIVADSDGYRRGQYALTVIKNPGPNARDPDGGDIAPGEYRTGSIGIGDLDAFAFSANAGDTATVLVAKTAGNYYFRPAMELHGPGGTVVATAEGERSATVGAEPLTQTGTYLVIVHDHAGTSEGQYALTVIKNPGPNAGDPDGGDVAPGEYKTGSIRIGDLDAFAFSARAGDRATVLVTKTEGDVLFYPSAELHAPDGSIVKTSSGERSAVIAGAPLAQTGTYLVVVRDRSGYHQGQYALNVFKNPGPNAGDPDGGDMAPGERKTGTIETGGDVDAYTFWANAGDTAKITVGNITGGLTGSLFFQPDVQLQGPDGTVIAIAWGEGSATVVAEPVTQTGTYLVIVRNGFGLYEGRYEIALRREPPALIETVAFQQAGINSATVAGDLTGTVDSNDLEFVWITTGSFAGQGYSRGMFQANLDGTTYPVTWGGVLFARPQEKRIYLKGAISGELLGTVEGYLTESTPESGIYDHYQATWKIRPADTPTMSGTIAVSGTLAYESPVEVSKTPIHVLQNNLFITADGDYDGVSLSAVVTSLKVIRPDNPSTLDGFSTISFTSRSGSGQAWTYDVQGPSGPTQMTGLISDPFFGVLSATWDEQNPLKPRSLTISRVDLGLPPAPDLKVSISGPQRASPGQTVNYLVEYKNRGMLAADNVGLTLEIPEIVKYVSASNGSVYLPPCSHGVVFWPIGTVSARTGGQRTLTVEVVWGLPQGTSVDVRSTMFMFPWPLPPAPIPGVPGVPMPPVPDEPAVPVPPWGPCGDDICVPLFECSWCSDCEIDDCTPDAPDLEPPDELPEPNLPEPTLPDGCQHDATFCPQQDEMIYAPSLSVDDLVDCNAGGVEGTLVYDERAIRTLQYSLGEGIGNNCDGTCTLIQRCQRWTVGLERTCTATWARFIDPEGGLKCAVASISCGDWRTVKTETEVTEQTRNCPCPPQCPQCPDACPDPKDEDGGTTTVVTAHDPNRKFGPQGNVAAGQKLAYKVECENEGEGIAFGVYFTDTLDPSLDDSTLEIGPVVDVNSGEQIGGAGTYNPETRTVIWFVGQVDPGQGGYADFSVSVRSDAPVGTEIINIGTVHFPSVPEETKTNAIISTIVAADSINARSNASLRQLSLLAMAWLEPDRMDAGW